MRFQYSQDRRWETLHGLYKLTRSASGQGRQNRFARPSDRRTNVCCMVPEKPISTILKVFRTSRGDNQLFRSLCMHKRITPPLYFAWPKLKCFCRPSTFNTMILPLYTYLLLTTTNFCCVAFNSSMNHIVDSCYNQLYIQLVSLLKLCMVVVKIAPIVSTANFWRGEARGSTT